MDRFTLTGAGREATRMLRDGEPLKDVWRFTVIQLLDAYESRLSSEGVENAAALFTDAPSPTGDRRVDAAFAALAEHLARRDGWKVPRWATSADRVTVDWWFVTDLRGMHPLALRESPLSFRKRGVFITSGALERV
ncbi:hypothetical protein CLV63_10426 [Murinocardiopsis flavida]|uniref:Uncharacterized protein n=1 Tax=Murinocardiopsis flavida TaxID=645275 RepID=A0A2P8DNK4_9ACTN|nr:hypothetical protein [Murinocardiopsis flavida]PSK98802.1 hypothetical protein CLV63_10426 [Murinocardiopsis flavida]